MLSNQARLLSLRSRQLLQMSRPIASALPGSSFFAIQQPLRMFSTKNDDANKADDSEKVEAPKRRVRKPKVSPEQKASEDPIGEEVKVATGDEGAQKPVKKRGKKTVAAKADEPQALSMYVMKFNSPILPYVKFPLTQNKYIQDFLKMYEYEKETVDKIIGVHFPKNDNKLAADTIGIEIVISKKNNLTVIESVSQDRFKILSYDAKSNFCQAVPYTDEAFEATGVESPKLVSEDHKKDLFAGELYELKNLWFAYNKNINQLLMMLPAEVLSRYDMVIKSLQAPVFDVTKYAKETNHEQIFNEIVYKMAQYYFAVFQALFTKDNEAMRAIITGFLSTTDPIHRSRKVINLFEEMHSIIEKKIYYVRKTAEEFKERSKTALLEHAYQKVLEDNKKSDKVKYQEKLDAVKNMPDSIRKVLQEEVNAIDNKSESAEGGRKQAYLNQVFRLPWDQRVEPFWDVHFSRQVLETSHFGMIETKERILEFIAKNKRVNSQKGMVLLLTGPPGVGKTSIAKSIGECLKRPTTVISMGGQNDPLHIRGSKRTYVDSQPGIFVKELQRLECKNPVIVIDEIDKVGFNSMKGDVSSTLLELLNPEQSNQFRDNYLDLEFDFSECIFICTSNSVANMLGPLIDRIEIINIPAYLPIEKLNIAKQYLIPSIQKEYGFGNQTPIAALPTEQESESKKKKKKSDPPAPIEQVSLTDASLMEIINSYCGHEAGVRNLRKSIDRIFRKIVAKLENSIAEPATNDAAGSVEYQVNSKNLELFLDIPSTDDTFYTGINKQLPIGTSNGLAYVNDGYGAVLKIQFVRREFQSHKTEDDKEKAGNGSLTHTGRLGEVMSESLQVVKLAVFNFLQHENLAKDFNKDHYHLHVPMGATPKDGPSAGTSLFAALVSVATQKPVAANLAMTGEITTLGEIITIGGVREKLTACKNHNITRVVLPLSNKKNVKKLPEEFKKGFTIYYVTNIKQLHRICFSEGLEDTDKAAFEQSLKDLGVEIEQFETDNFNKVVFENEAISTTNQVNNLF